MPRAERKIGGSRSEVAAVARFDPQPRLALERFGGLAGDKVDCPAHAARPVQHRDITLLDLNLGKVGGQEAAEIQSIVGGQIDADPVDRKRRLYPVKTTYKDKALIAAAAGISHGDARHRSQSIVQRAPVGALDLFGCDRAGGSTLTLGVVARVDDHGAQIKERPFGILLRQGCSTDPQRKNISEHCERLEGHRFTPFIAKLHSGVIMKRYVSSNITIRN